jgi:hypothetical protein
VICQKREPLSDVIVKISRNPGPFLFLGLDEPSAHAGKCLFRLLAFGDVGDNS